MFERLTESARKVVVLAQEEARRFRHGYVGTEHLLLGLLLEEASAAGMVLKDLGVTLEAARSQVEDVVGYGSESYGSERIGAEAGEDTVASLQVPFTPRAKRVFELALREALTLGHNYIGTKHLLLGLVGEKEGVAARVLSNLKVDANQIRKGVVELLNIESRQVGPAPEAKLAGSLDLFFELRRINEELAMLRREITQLREELGDGNRGGGTRKGA
jgi:ATP-dependent Clp protease ATP-binding subunit ClpC